MRDAPVIVWFRQDLRLSDNAALVAAAAGGRPLLPVYILDDTSPGKWAMGGASRWWLHHSLVALDLALRKLGARLILRRGRSLDTLQKLAAETGAGSIYFTRCYEPFAIAVEHELKAVADLAGIDLRRFSGSLLFEPEDISAKHGGPFRVFTPFWKTCLDADPPAEPAATPARLTIPRDWPRSDSLASWQLLPRRPDWAHGLRRTWQPGEAGARRRLDTFLSDTLLGYAETRDRLDRPGTSMLSPHLHFGEISPRQCWHAVREAEKASSIGNRGGASFLREIGWREFSTHLLFSFPRLTDEPFRPEFERFPWSSDATKAACFEAWSHGRTGYPIVDAGMRQLWRTGYMHNRARMVTASFLTKHLGIRWSDGACWFWDTLVDADLANNSASWQWVAGSGADAAPYFRIFNPVLQGQKFDPDGSYVRQWVPEIAALPAAQIHAPWLAPSDVLETAGVRLGESYPRPIVDHSKARSAALSAYATMKAAVGRG